MLLREKNLMFVLILGSLAPDQPTDPVIALARAQADKVASL